MIHKKVPPLNGQLKYFFYRFHGANLTLSPDADQDTQNPGLHARKTPAHQCISSKTYKSRY